MINTTNLSVEARQLHHLPFKGEEPPTDPGWFTTSHAVNTCGLMAKDTGRHVPVGGGPTVGGRETHGAGQEGSDLR